MDIFTFIFVGICVVIGLLVTDYEDRHDAVLGCLLAVSLLVFGWLALIGVPLWGLWTLVRDVRRKQVEQQVRLNEALWTRKLTREELYQLGGVR